MEYRRKERGTCPSSPRSTRRLGFGFGFGFGLGLGLGVGVGVGVGLGVGVGVGLGLGLGFSPNHVPLEPALHPQGDTSYTSYVAELMEKRVGSPCVA